MYCIIYFLQIFSGVAIRSKYYVQRLKITSKNYTITRKGLFCPASIKEKDDKPFDCQGHTLRNGADQERRKFVVGSSPDRCDSTARKEALGRVLRYRFSVHSQNARAAGDQTEVGVGFSTKETRIIGALGPDAVHMKVVDSINAETFIEFLKELRQAHKKFIVFLENLSAHKAVKVARYIESTDGDVILAYLPKYTPQLNPMEIQWMVLKNMTAQRCFKNAEELAKSIRILVDTGQLLPVKRMDYMIS